MPLKRHTLHIFFFLITLRSLRGSSEWVKTFCAAPGNRCLLEVPLSFIEDPVTANAVLNDIKTVEKDDDVTIATIESAVLLLCGKIRNVHAYTETEITSVEIMAEKIYSLFHARYCLSNGGLKSVKTMFEKAAYGVCPRVGCNNFPLLPLGLDDDPDISTAKCFCGKCRESYQSPLIQHRHLDSSYFGSSLPHLFFHRYIKMAPVKNTTDYIPRIFGFKLHHSASELRKYRGEYS
jgi:casein kinase II subunit beta